MTEHVRPMKSIPVSAGKLIADSYGYDQVVIVARRVGVDPEPHGEHVTTFGRSVAHCAIAARMGDVLKHGVMGWPDDIPAADLDRLADMLWEAFHAPMSTRADVMATARHFAKSLGIVSVPARSR